MEYIRQIIYKSLVIISLSVVGLSSCRQDDEIVPTTHTQVTTGEELRSVGAFYLLNEGNMGSNKATLDYFDYFSGQYLRNIFAERNPEVKKELGDVGNDLSIYGSKLWAVINNSHLVEVMDASSARHLGAIPIANCRYITFSGRYAYVSSYAGEIKLDPNARLGYVAKIDTASLQEVSRCPVGYQPEEMAVVGNKLYVANSGGYRTPHYDTRISVIDLNTFTLERHFDVAINLHRLVADSSGLLWVSSRGDYGDTPSRLYVVDPSNGRTIQVFDMPCSGMTLDGDKLYGYGQDYKGNTAGEVNYFVIDTKVRKSLDTSFVADNLRKRIRTPYGIAVNPETHSVLIADAGDFVTPGRLYALDISGRLMWEHQTGNIPSSIAFLPKVLTRPYEPKREQGGANTIPNVSPYITKVLAYKPAPGQHVNKLPEYNQGDTEEQIKAKVFKAIGENRRGLITLGGWGGYVEVGFDHTIQNVRGKRDFRVLGNTIDKWGEPGVIYVAYDKNKNGIADDDEWYEIAGSASAVGVDSWISDQRARGKDVALYRDYSVTYTKPTNEGQPKQDIPNYIHWQNNKGESGYLPKNVYHDQSYYPLWIKENSYSLSGVRLPQNGYNSLPDTSPSPRYILLSFAYGYADNVSNGEPASSIDIDWAIDSLGRPVSLPGVDFIRIQTGVHQVNGWLGENSTEVMGVEDLHLLKESI